MSWGLATAGAFRASLLLLGLLGAACGSGTEQQAAAAPSKPAPAFDLERVRGGRLTSEDLRGRTLVIDFWATWCVPCIKSIPELNALHAAYKDRGISVVGISVDDDKQSSEVLAWVENSKKHEPIWYELLRGDLALAEAYGSIGGVLPHTAIVSPEGQLIATLEPGMQTQAAIEDALRAHGQL